MPQLKAKFPVSGVRFPGSAASRWRVAMTEGSMVGRAVAVAMRANPKAASSGHRGY